jgi:hypothetical protein
MVCPWTGAVASDSSPARVSKCSYFYLWLQCARGEVAVGLHGLPEPDRRPCVGPIDLTGEPPKQTFSRKQGRALDFPLEMSLKVLI